jgi:hypothetical protein
MGWEAWDGETWFPVKDVRVKVGNGGDTSTFSVSVAFTSAPSLANEAMEPEKLVGEGGTPKPDGECSSYDYGRQCDEWECAPVAIRDRRVIWDWVRNFS